MANSFFSFKQFTVHQHHSAMKVGTDGVLLGAWAALRADVVAPRLLDIGCGTGLLSLMAAQRSPLAQIDAVEIDAAACRDAAGNFAASPWSERLYLHQCAIQEYAASCTERYDVLLSNPPYFSETLHSPVEARVRARHALSLPQSDLLEGAARLLSERGLFSLILPVSEADSLVREAQRVGLCVQRRLWVHPLPDRPAKRVLLELGRKERVLEESCLVIETGERHVYSTEYMALTRDFYLKF